MPKDISSKCVWKNEGDTENVYLLNVPVVYAVVHKPKLKYQSTTESEYSAIVFVDKDVADYIQDEIKVNKTFAQVGVDKTKKRTIKYPLSSQDDKKRDTYDAYKGMYGLSLSCPAKTRTGADRYVKVFDDQGIPMTDDIGNGSIISVKLFGYRNDDGLLNVTMNTIKVVELVPYTKNTSDGDDILGLPSASDLM